MKLEFPDYSVRTELKKIGYDGIDIRAKLIIEPYWHRDLCAAGGVSKAQFIKLTAAINNSDNDIIQRLRQIKRDTDHALRQRRKKCIHKNPRWAIRQSGYIYPCCVCWDREIIIS